MVDHDLLESINRRSVLRFASLAGGVGMVSSGASARGDRRSESENGSRDSTQLGTFETGLDHWRTNGGNELTRVTEEDVPVGVASGEHGLAVEVDGDLYPMIENEKRVKDADLLHNPYLAMHVVAYAEDTDSDIVFRFRLHHTATPASNTNGAKGDPKDRKKRKRGSNRKESLVEESEPHEISQLRPQRIQWDMSDRSAEVLKTAKRLEIVWYLDDYEPDEGPRGRTTGDFDYRGLAVFDDVQVSASPLVSESQKQQQKRMNLHRNHGMIVDRTFEERTADIERGTLVYADGTEIPYEFEVLEPGAFRYTIDGETFEIGGGNQ